MLRDTLWVCLEAFRAGYFYTQHDTDTARLEAFGLTMPPVYGYKRGSAPKQGLVYSEWREGLRERLLACDEVKALLTEKLYLLEEEIPERAVGPVVRTLGLQHVLTQYIERVLQAQKVYHQASHAKRSTVDWLAQDDKQSLNLDDWPLLKTQDFSVLWGEHAELWLTYVKEWK